MEKEYPCAQCKMRRKYDKDPKSLIARFWHWLEGIHSQPQRGGERRIAGEV